MRRRWRARASGCAACAAEALVLQFGGAAGTLAALGDRGLDVAERLAALLDLPLPDAPWHSHRDRLAEVAAAFAILAGTCGKIARDVALLMQTEVGEAFEPAAAGRGGSSTMPHKRNPGRRPRRSPPRPSRPISPPPSSPRRCRSTSARSAAGRPNGRPFRRSRSSPRARSPPSSTSPRGSKSMPSACAPISTRRGGQIMAEAVSFALADKLGKQEAHRSWRKRAERRCRRSAALKDVLREDKRVTAHLSAGELAKLFEPMGYQGVAQIFIDRHRLAERAAEQAQ